MTDKNKADQSASPKLSRIKDTSTEAQRYLFTLAPVGADLVLLVVIEVLLWIA